MKLSERMKHWPALTVHRVVEIEAALVSLDERLAALEPKKFDVKEVKPAPFVPPVPIGPGATTLTPIPEPSVLPAPKPPGFNKPEVKPTFVSPPKTVDEPKTNIFAPPNPVGQPWQPEPKPEPPIVRLDPSYNPLDGTNLKS